MRYVGKYGFFSLLFLLAGSSNAWADSAESRATWFFLLSVTGGISLVIAYVLYRGAHLKSKVDLEAIRPEPLQEPSAAKPHEPLISVREKIKRIPNLKIADDETAVKQISKLVEDETRERIQEIKQEYNVKYQVAVQEKSREVEQVKRDFASIKAQYDEVEKKFKEADIEKKQTEAVVRSIAEGLVVVNNKGDVLLMNPSAEKLLGTEKEKKIGKNILEGLPNELMVSLARESGEAGEKVIEFTSKSENTKKILRASSAVIQNENGQTVGMLNILTDVTKQRELDEIKTSFVSNITHELRTPIVAMQKAASLLLNQQAGPLNDVQTNFVNIVSRNLGHLSRLVEDLLDVAKIDAGKMRIRLSTCRLDKVINDACDSLDTWARSKGVAIKRELEKSLPEMPIDPDKITQVLNNLIGNAIKFTPTGGTIFVRADWTADGKIKVEVEDNGVGISPENLTKLFKRFEQFGDQTGITGTGLGLSITKEIIERHGGVIDVKSREKKGTTFSFTLPAKLRTPSN